MAEIEPARLSVERRLGDAMRRHLPWWIADFVMFGLKMAWAALFGGLLLTLIIVSAIVWPANATLARYDALLIAAVAIQATFLAVRLETWAEARVIVLFHISGTLMEVFKVHVGSWSYPEPGVVKLFDVPLFSGFMYASVGSFIARAMRVFDMRFYRHPPLWASLALAAAIYANFFAHHFVWDARYLLMAAAVFLFARTTIVYRISTRDYWMPLPLAAFLSALFLYVAENVGTMTGTWIYAGNTTYHLASPAKLGSWFMLLFVSFAQVSFVMRSHLFCGGRAKAGQLRVGAA